MNNTLISLYECRKLIGGLNPWLNLMIGAIGGWGLTRGMTYLSRPNIEMIVGGEAYLLQHTANEIKFLHVKVINKTRNLFMRFLFGNPTLNNARAWISFIDPVTKTEIFKINGRWTTTKEPINYDTNKVDFALAILPSREIIPAGEESEISIAIKSINESSTYAFNNESYLHKWKKSDFELIDNRYLIEVKVAADGNEWKKRFVLLNPGKSTANFKLIMQ